MSSISKRIMLGGAVSLSAELVQTHKTYSAFICRLPRQQISYTAAGDLIYLLLRNVPVVYDSGVVAEPGLLHLT